SAVVLSGGLMPPGARKHAWRRGVLASRGVSDACLATPDLVDAALAALTGVLALAGRCCWLGEPGEGVIVLPCTQAELPKRFERLTDPGGAAGPNQAGPPR